MLDIAALIPTLLKKAKALPPGHHLSVRTYKRDRGFLLIRQDDDRFLIIEDGYEDKDHECSLSDLKKTLKPIIRREFPRSKKAYVYSKGAWKAGNSEEPAAQLTLPLA